MILSIFSSYLKARSLDLCKAIRQPVSDLAVIKNGEGILPNLEINDDTFEW